MERSRTTRASAVFMPRPEVTRPCLVAAVSPQLLRDSVTTARASSAWLQGLAMARMRTGPLLHLALGRLASQQRLPRTVLAATAITLYLPPNPLASLPLPRRRLLEPARDALLARRSRRRLGVPPSLTAHQLIAPARAAPHAAMAVRVRNTASRPALGPPRRLHPCQASAAQPRSLKFSAMHSSKLKYPRSATLPRPPSIMTASPRWVPAVPQETTPPS